MKASIIRIGNSHGVRIPKLILDQCGFSEEVELEVHNLELIIRSPKRSRKDWARSFKKMALNKDDQLIDPVETDWANEEWEWE